MPRSCSICQHQNRTAIEKMLVSNASYRVIARQFNVGHDSLKRHVDGGHIKASVAAEQVAKDTQRTIDVERQMYAVNASMLRMYSELSSDKRTYLAANQIAKTLGQQWDFAHRIGKDEEIEKRLEALEDREGIA